MVLSIKSEHRRLTTRVNKLTTEMKKGIKVAWQDIGKDLKLELKQDMLRPKTGRIYSIRGRQHQASAPSERPASLSGLTRRGVSYRAYGWYKMEFGLQSSYAPFLEDGTTKMEARKPLERTVIQNYRDINQRLRKVGVR